jgi:hypothetical protein
MYYYITEPPRSREDREAEERIRELLIRSSIAGEFVVTSPTRGVEELAEMGVAKKYTTLVAVGNETLINQLGTLLAGTPYVFGAIPVTRPNALASVNGIQTYEEAVEALKFRRVHSVPICRIEPNKFFISELLLSAEQDITIRLRIDDALVEATCRKLRLSGSGKIVLEHHQQPANGAMDRFRRLFTRTEPAHVTYSRFSGNIIAIETSQPYSLYLGNEVFVRTPLAATVIHNSLKIITRRDTLAPLSDKKQEGTEVVFQTNNW